MSKNKHQINTIKGISLQYMQELGSWKQCPKSSCKGCMVEILCQYKDHGPIHHEWECSVCQKIIRDPRFQRNNNYNRKRYSTKKTSFNSSKKQGESNGS